jgi:glycerol uptake facilitator-like aquaporin
MNTKQLAKLVAELVGTFTLTAVVLVVGRTYGTPLFTTFAAAVALAAMVSVLGHVSGGHFNPALTLGMLSTNKASLKKAVTYIPMQIAGAVLAWKAYEWVVGDPRRAVTQIGVEFDWKIFAAELVGMVIFALAVSAVAAKKQSDNTAGATVGMGLLAGSLATSVVVMNKQIVSGVLNPAVAIGIGFRPENSSYWAYLLGPVAGAVIGMNMYKYFFSGEQKVSLGVKPVVAVPAVNVKASTVKAPAKKMAAPKKKTVAKKK